MIPSLPPHANGTAMTMACVLAVGGIFLFAAPQPESGGKQGATRASAVPSGTVASPQTQSDTKAQVKTDVKTDVKIIGASAESSRPCDEQTWPYIEQRCLIPADSKTAQNNKGPTPPLGLRDMLAGVRPAQDDASAAPAKAAPAADQPVGSVTAIAPTPPVEQMQASTVGAGARDDEETNRDSVQAEAGVPLPTPRPEIAVASLSASEDTEDASIVPSSAAPLSRREQREQRRMEREQRRLERAERRASDPNRIVRRWTEYSYDDDSRVIVIQQGSRRDRFFQNYR